MAKLALALASIVLLALSTGLTHTQLGQTPLDQRSIPDLSTGQPGTVASEMAVFSVADASVAPHADLEAPPLALLVYLIVILLGSGLAIGVVRQRQLR
jgi:hypothetical protein